LTTSLFPPNCLHWREPGERMAEEHWEDAQTDETSCLDVSMGSGWQWMTKYCGWLLLLWMMNGGWLLVIEQPGLHFLLWRDQSARDWRERGGEREGLVACGCGACYQFQILRKLSQDPVHTAVPSSVTPRQLTRLSWPASTPAPTTHHR
jgi:hypothetical protein